MSADPKCGRCGEAMCYSYEVGGDRDGYYWCPCDSPDARLRRLAQIEELIREPHQRGGVMWDRTVGVDSEWYERLRALAQPHTQHR